MGSSIELHPFGTGNRHAFIDFHGDDIWTDYALRIMRSSAGPNAISEIIHRGTGSLFLRTVEAGSIVFATNNTSRLNITSEGRVGIGVYPNAEFDMGGVGGRIQFTRTQSTLVEGNNNGGAIYFGADIAAGNNNPTAAIETSWGGVHTPQIAMGVIREQNRKSAVLFDFSGNAVFYSYNTERMRLNGSGNLGIGTASPTHKLTVNGPIRAKEVIVDTGWADDVFLPDYRLASLKEVEAHIEQEGRLPGMPSVTEVAENGLSVGEAQSLLLRKIEELTLHVIRLEKKNEQLEQRLAEITEPSK
ncbi:hypothetical protein OpiT1DRAFT_03303 [Opitutaceae bacterium TAV1]|nr:hypothetical protein OpiT1DRAFT_03303 [Opitutaceae bacterium TAV1]